jgi:hypothetical protein
MLTLLEPFCGRATSVAVADRTGRSRPKAAQEKGTQILFATHLWGIRQLM